MIKREWIKLLKDIKANPRQLTPTECDELILLLGGTARPNHRPVRMEKGELYREARAGVLADLVFEYFDMGKVKSRAEAERLTAEALGCSDLKRGAKAIQNELVWYRGRLGLRRLGVKEWVAYKNWRFDEELRALAPLLAKALGVRHP